MSTASRPTLFASLRRDRFPFALLGALVLLLNALQPLAAAQMQTGGHLVICTALDTGGTSVAGEPSSHPLDDCQVCLIGSACGAAAYKAAPASSAAFPVPARLVALTLSPAASDGPPAWLTAPPPAIRAPPLSA